MNGTSEKADECSAEPRSPSSKRLLRVVEPEIEVRPSIYLSYFLGSYCIFYFCPISFLLFHLFGVQILLRLLSTEWKY